MVNPPLGLRPSGRVAPLNCLGPTKTFKKFTFGVRARKQSFINLLLAKYLGTGLEVGQQKYQYQTMTCGIDESQVDLHQMNQFCCYRGTSR